MANFLFRQNTTHLSNINFDLSKQAGFTLEQGVYDAIIEAEKQDIALMEALEIISDKAKLYVEADIAEEDQTELVVKTKSKLVEIIKNSISWFIEKINALFKLFKETISKFFSKWSNKTKKWDNNIQVVIDYGSKISENNPEIRWFRNSSDVEKVFANINFAGMVQCIKNIINNDRSINDIYIRNKSILDRDLGLKSQVDELEDLIDSITSMPMSLSPDFQDSNRARQTGEKLHSIYNSLMEHSEKYIRYRDMLEGSMVSSLVRMSIGLSSEMFMTIKKSITAIMSETIIQMQRLTNLYIKLISIYDANMIKVEKAYNLAFDDLVNNSPRYGNFRDSKNFFNDSYLIDELCAIEWEKQWKNNTIDQNGRIILV